MVHRNLHHVAKKKYPSSNGVIILKLNALRLNILNNDHINNTKINNSILKGEKKGTLLVYKGTCTFALESMKC